MLPPGLYEQVINTALNRELSEIPDTRKSVAPIDRAEASKVLAQYLADVVQKGLENVADNGGDISTQIGLANQIVNLIQNTTKEADFASLSVDLRAEQLLALLQEQDPRLAVGKTAADLSRPETSIAQSSLFTGAIHEPQMYTELKKEIVSADRIDMLVSFIKWSGLRLLIDELREFTQNGGELRIITTSYMGATDVKAIEELRKLPNTKIKVSYDTKRTRLHAKTYIFCRNTGFTTAYVGSSNLSNAAISSGLEWNVKVTRRDLPETIDKIAATFESYWNSNEFEYYSEDQKERLARALKAEKYFDANNAEVYTMDIAPYSYQQEILDKLEAERAVRGYGDLARYIEYNNCVVIESTVYSVFDLLYQGYAEQRRDFLKKHGRVSEYDSENLAYAVIQNILQKAEFSFVDCAAHVSLVNLVKDYSVLTEEETAYARNPLTHVDFLLFRRMDKSPLLAVEVDGAAFHAAGSVQANRDEKKNRIFGQCGIPLLRLRTDGSREEARIEQALRSAVSNS